ncbi:MAG TPA: ABC transporter ATP-binding protein [Actinocrinis sp.]|nr:ABC transporter ATP-binding protein [Actinocrinis sp.]
MARTVPGRGDHSHRDRGEPGRPPRPSPLHPEDRRMSSISQSSAASVALPDRGPGLTGTDPLLVVQDLDVTFATGVGPVHAVRGVSFELAEGRCLAIVGESGSGKSVTARTLVGLTGGRSTVRATRISFDGRDLTALSETPWRAVRGREIGLVFQDALVSLDPLRTVGAEVAEPLRTHHTVNRAEVPAEVLSLLTKVGIPDPERRAEQYPHQLSGGLRQRALIASAIAAEPRLILADEPTTALDVTVQAQILELLEHLKQDGSALLLISHDLAVVARLADRIAVMYAGLIVEQGPAEEILADPQHPYTQALIAAVPSIHAKGTALSVPVVAQPPAGPGGCPYAARCARADQACRDGLPDLADAGDGHVALCWHPGAGADFDLIPIAELQPAAIGPAAIVSVATEPVGTEPAATEPGATVSVTSESVAESDSTLPSTLASTDPGELLLDIDAISKRFRSPDGTWYDAVQDVSFQVHRGETLGLVGESGSGKTTAARIVLGLLAPDQGQVRFDGESWSALPERERRTRRRRIQAVYQDPLGSFDPRYTVERILREATSLAGIRRGAESRSRIAELLDQVGLSATLLTRRPRDLSGGQRQRVAIARALAPSPDVLVCDEPVSALDVSIQAQILDLLAALQRDLRMALLFISHDLGVIHHVSDRIVVMKDGRVVETGQTAQVFSNPAAAYTKELLAAVPRLN